MEQKEKHYKTFFNFLNTKLSHPWRSFDKFSDEVLVICPAFLCRG
mgnify:CR=1 FL=1